LCALIDGVDACCMMMHHLESETVAMPARKVTPNPSERLTVTLDAEDKAELERLAKASDRSLAWVVRDALRQYLEKARPPARGKAE